MHRPNTADHLIDGDSAVRRLQESRSRFELHDSLLNAVINWNPHAGQAALKADAEEGRGTRRSALHGQIIALKDNLDTADVKTTAGASFWVDRQPHEDAEVVRILRQAGAVIAAKTNMSEVALGPVNANRTFGACRNPWDPNRVSGGSSGGSAVAVAAGYCDLSVGTETGGSIRIPSALNGILGLRPSRGRISAKGVVPLSPSQDTVGPMGRYAEQVAQLTDLLTAEEHRTSIAFAPASSRIGLGLADLVVGVVENFGDIAVDPEIAERMDAFIDALTSLGARVQPIKIADWAEAAPIWTAIAPCEGALQFAKRLHDNPETFAPDVLERLRAGSMVGKAAYEDALNSRDSFRSRMRARFDVVDAILSPTTPISAPRIAPREDEHNRIGALMHPWALHEGPTLNIPAGFDSNGLPIGLSLAAAYGNEATLFQIAHAYQGISTHHLTISAVSEPPVSAQRSEQ